MATVSKETYIVKCWICGTKFATTNGKRKYCSEECKRLSKSRLKAPIKVDPCECSRVKTCAFSGDFNGGSRCCAFLLYTGQSRVILDKKNGYSGYPEDCPHYTTSKSVKKTYKERLSGQK